MKRRSPFSNQVDLLDVWMGNLFVVSSKLNPWAPIRRERLVKIEMCLRELFPARFFLHQFGRDILSSDLHVVKRLLLNSQRYENVSALAEICDILKFCRSNLPELWKQLGEQMNNSTQYEATLYEAFVARGLMKSGLEYKNNYTIDGIARDGLVTYKGDSFIVECKKLFAPKLVEFNLLQRAFDSVISSAVDRPIIGPYTLELLMERPVQGRSISVLNELLGDAYTAFLRNGQSFVVAEKFVRKGAALSVIPHSILHVPTKSDDNHLVLTWDVTRGPSFTENGHATISLSGEFGFSDADVLKKLRSSISKARKQHKAVLDTTRIIFADSQELGDGQLGVLHGNEMLLREDIIPRIREVVKEDIVIVTRRTYDFSRAKFKFYSFNDLRYQALVERIRKGFAPQKGAIVKRANDNLEGRSID